MVIHLLRHAEAEDVSPTGRDADRPLTEAAARRMKALARALKRLDPGYDLILVSPLVRSRQTAEIVARACGLGGKLTESQGLLPNAAPEEVLEELARAEPSAALLVGHQPHLGRLFGRLLLGRTDVEVAMKKAAFAAFETGRDPSREKAELKLYLPPRVLEMLA